MFQITELTINLNFTVYCHELGSRALLRKQIIIHQGSKRTSYLYGTNFWNALQYNSELARHRNYKANFPRSRIHSLRQAGS
jgi:hypothetical protein